jgi:hypothetical protein
MSETPSIPSTFSRTACLQDFLDDSKIASQKFNNYSQNDKNTIAKNQQEFGNRKRIKP